MLGLFDILYPIFFAVYPVLELFDGNIGEIPTSGVYRSLVVVSLTALILIIIFSIPLRNREKGALLTSGFLILFYSYGHIYEQVEGLSIGSMIIGRHRYLLVIWAVATIAWTFWVLRQKSVNNAVKKSLQIFGILLVIFPLISIVYYQFGSTKVVGSTGLELTDGAIEPYQQLELPDVYYIILDAYGRDDVLEELYSLENTDFLGFLESRGFFVARQSTSNYSQTILSLASSLNMIYLDDLVEQEGKDSGNLRPLDEMIARSVVRDIFAKMGYEFIAFETGYHHTEVRNADVYLAPDYKNIIDQPTAFSAFPLNEFEGMLLSTTLIRAANEYFTQSQTSALGLTDFLYQKHRMRIYFTIDSLGEIADDEDNHFVFAHIVSPHEPFVFGRFGEVVPNQDAFTLQANPTEESAPLYANQVIYISRLLEDTIDEILMNSDTPPIIVLQSDHGPNAFMNSSSSFETGIWERMSILNAYFVPEEVEGLLYPSITPVNTFRAILAGGFGSQIELLEDENYFSPPGHPYNISGVTDILKAIP